MSGTFKYCTFALFTVTSSWLWATEGTDGIRTALQADNLVIVQAGEKIYQTQCAACHGANLEGQPNWRTRNSNGFLPAPPHDATGHTWHHADDLLFQITKYGPGAIINDDNYKTAMPAYKHILSDEQIISVLSFIKNSWPEDQRSWQEEVNGTSREGFLETPKKSPSFLDKLLK